MIFETFGNKQNPAILFFHAMGVTGASSEPVVRYLQDRYFCILPTSTVYCAGQKYRGKTDEVRQVEVFLRAQGVERLALVACLLAVIPALNLATSDAAAVAGLVMTVLTVGLVSCAGKSLPRFWPGDFFPTFYACHLAVLGVLAL